jgi:hypothetical protein
MSNQRYQGSHSEDAHSVCKTVYAGSIPAVASTHFPREINSVNGLAERRTNESGESSESDGDQRRHKREHREDGPRPRGRPRRYGPRNTHAGKPDPHEVEIITPKITVGEDELLARMQRALRKRPRSIEVATTGATVLVGRVLLAPEQQDLTAALMGDPPRERSALAMRGGAR